MKPNKSLGQHWLKDQHVLDEITDAAHISAEDTVFEIGPGLGTLTAVLEKKAKRVIALEFDTVLARNLKKRYKNSIVEIAEGDILSFDLTSLPPGYKVVANIPYYITAKIIQALTTSQNTPSIAVLLVQKEVAERLAASPGKLSILGVSAQYFAEVSLGRIVGAELFTPPPKVDSQVVILKTHQTPLFPDIDQSDFFNTVKAGFSSKRKKLRTSLSGGFGIDKKDAEILLEKAHIDPGLRAEALTLEQWAALSRIIKL